MKTTRLLLIIFACIMYASCEQNSEDGYSCNPYVNNWTKQNISEIQQMSRQNWKELDDSLKLAVYRAFSPEQKVVFWKEKFQEVRSLNWSIEELEHICCAENYMDEHKYLFSHKLSDDEVDDLETFFYSWQREGIERLGWSKEIAISIAGTGLPMSKENDVNYTVIKGSNSNYHYDCHCNKKTLSDFCNVSGFLGICSDINPCDETNVGCGWLWLENCNGICIGSNIKI